MGRFFGWFLGENTDKLRSMLKARENKVVLLQSEIDEIRKEIARRENEHENENENK